MSFKDDDELIALAQNRKYLHAARLAALAEIQKRNKLPQNRLDVMVKELRMEMQKAESMRNEVKQKKKLALGKMPQKIKIASRLLYIRAGIAVIVFILLMLNAQVLGISQSFLFFICVRSILFLIFMAYVVSQGSRWPRYFMLFTLTLSLIIIFFVESAIKFHSYFSIFTIADLLMHVFILLLLFSTEASTWYKTGEGETPEQFDRID